MEALARSALWRAGLHYQHGTGHCHSSPMPDLKKAPAQTVLLPGMCQANGPAYYGAEKFGCRVLNTMMVEAHPEHPDYLRWRNLTLVPFCRELIDIRLLTEAERLWIDSFNANCLAELTPLLQENQ